MIKEKNLQKKENKYVTIVTLIYIHWKYIFDNKYKDKIVISVYLHSRIKKYWKKWKVLINYEVNFLRNLFQVLK